MKTRTTLSKLTKNAKNNLHSYLNNNETYTSIVSMIERRNFIIRSNGIVVTLFEGSLYEPKFDHKLKIGTLRDDTFVYNSGKEAASIESVRLVLSHYPSLVFQKNEFNDEIDVFCI